MKKNIISTCMVFIIITMMLASGCSTNDNTGDVSDSATQNPTVTSGSDSQSAAADESAALLSLSVTEKYKDEDLDSSWDAASSTIITLQGEAAAVSGEGAEVSGGTVTITKSGTYVVSGTLTGGQILINASKDDLVRLVLNGADITSKTNAAIYAAVADKLVLILADGTENSVTDAGAGFTYADSSAEEPDAALFSKCDLSINGGGALTVNAGFYNGIGTKDDLVIAGGQLTVNAANNGIRGRDSVTVLDGSLDITAGNDGLQSNNDEDTSLGWILIKGGTFNITAANDGIQAETVLEVSEGTFNVNSAGGASGSVSDTESYKGLKAAEIVISGGGFTIDSADDCIHSNGNVTISGGNFTLASGDDGVHADSALTINDGNINITKSYEGLEGATVDISGGTINIAASDDGINAAGGSDGGMGGMFGRDSFASSGSYYINISGGDITLTAGGDGFDSNGDINVSGGTIVSLINSSSDNEAMDYEGTFTITGGTIIYGGTGAGQGPGGSSTQSYVSVSSGVTADTEITVKKDGQTLITFAPSIDCQYLAFSSPDIIAGESYDIYSGSDLLITLTGGTGNTGGMGGMGGMGGQGGQGGQGFPGGTDGQNTLPDGSQMQTPPDGMGGQGGNQRPGG